jgi:tyrosine-specific transport protein
MKINKVIGGTLLVAGTCIGAGMLALPITTGGSGFIYSTLLLAVMWFAMFLTGLYVLEANILLPPGANFISMAKATLGKVGDVVAWITYLLLLYSLMAAYLSGGGDIVMSALRAVTRMSLSEWVAPLPWVILGALIIYLGVKFVDEINRMLILGLVVTYFLLIFIMTPHVDLTILNQGNPKFLFSALPVVITSFGYHVIIPSLRNYLEGDAHKLVKIIFWGSLAPLVVYVLWELVVFGTVPVTGSDGLESIFQSAHPASKLTQSLENLLHNSTIVEIANFFIFFAIATSFL